MPDAGGLILTSAKAILASTIRTFVPLLVGVVVSVFAKLHIPVDAGTAQLLVDGAVSSGVALLYYVLARVLEVTKSSKFGWLLGYAKAAPIYVAPAAAANVAQDAPADEEPEIKPLGELSFGIADVPEK